jgi:hypothetical protein
MGFLGGFEWYAGLIQSPWTNLLITRGNLVEMQRLGVHKPLRKRGFIHCGFVALGLGWAARRFLQQISGIFARKPTQ